MSTPITIGLFGTCGGSKWRDAFVGDYAERGFNFFNPLKENWKPEDAEEEAEHLLEDDIVLFPVTHETYGTGSLAETGYSIFQAIKSPKQRFVVIYISKDLDPILKDNPQAYKESLNSRAIVRAHLKKAKYPHVFVVESLEDMLHVSCELHHVLQALNRVREIHCA